MVKELTYLQKAKEGGYTGILMDRQQAQLAQLSILLAKVVNALTLVLVGILPTQVATRFRAKLVKARLICTILLILPNVEVKLAKVHQ